MTDHGQRSRRTRPTGGKGGCESRATIRDRERVVMTMSSEGYTQHEIAERVGVSQAGGMTLQEQQRIESMTDEELAELGRLTAAVNELLRGGRGGESLC